MRTLKITYFDGEINLDDCNLITLVLNNKKMLYKFCNYCFDDFPDTTVALDYYIDDKLVDNDKNIHFIPHTYGLNLNTKKNINALYKLLKKKYYDELSSNIELLKDKIIDIVKEISKDFDVELTADDDISNDDLFKIMNLEFKEEDNNNLVSKFCKYLKVIYELQGIKVFVIPFLHLFFSNEEILMIFNEIKYDGLTLISLETSIINKIFDGHVIRILDFDLCSL